MIEREIKMRVPLGRRKPLLEAIARPPAKVQRVALVARYYDTPERLLAGNGVALRLRREGRRWVQTLKMPGADAFTRFEHEVPRPDATLDLAAHAGTAGGERLAALLAGSREPLGIRYETDIRRVVRRIRTRGAVVELAFDSGAILAFEQALPVCELEIELVSGSYEAMLALTGRWRERFGLIVDPRSKAERGDRLADGVDAPPPRKAKPPRFAAGASAREALKAAVDECLDQVMRNAIELADGGGRERSGRPIVEGAEYVHQVRVGLRRLRSALRTFRGWVEAPPVEIEQGARRLFGRLSGSRDRDVVREEIVPLLERAGAPSLALPAQADAADAGEVLRSADAQGFLMDCIAWSARLAASPAEPPARTSAPQPAVEGAGAAAPAEGFEAGTPDEPAPGPLVSRAPSPAEPLDRLAARRLRKWHRALVEDGRRFASLDVASRHRLRKRSKRQRYAVEFLAPLFRPKRVRDYVAALSKVQDALGELNDLSMAADLYRPALEADPKLWFVLGWLSARGEAVAERAQRALDEFAKVEEPWRSRRS